MTRVNATTLAACSPEQAWDVILDYPEIPRYQELVDSSCVMSEHGGTTLVHQEGTGTFIITKRLRFDLEFRRLDPETVAFRQVKGDFAAFDGTWSVVPESSGVRIRFASNLRSGLPLPGFILRRILRRHAIKMMPALAAEIARRYRAGPASLPQEAERSGLLHDRCPWTERAAQPAPARPVQALAHRDPLQLPARFQRSLVGRAILPRSPGGA